MAHIEFFFDLSSPWTRLAFQNIQSIVSETGASITWKPFLVGGVFNAVNQGVYAGRADPNSPRNRHTNEWLKDWARLAGVPMHFPSAHHPLKSVNAMRVCCVLEDDQAVLFAFADRAFNAYFAEMQNLDDPRVLTAIADECGLSGEAITRKAGEEAAKTHLRANTQEVIDRGGFGSPTLFVDKERMFFGNDQLPLVRQAILDAASA